MGGRPDILNLLNLISCAASLEEAQIAFALLTGEDPTSAAYLAIVLDRALPGSGPIWMAIMDRAKERVVVRHPKPFRWTAKDAGQTVDGVARFLQGERGR